MNKMIRIAVLSAGLLSSISVFSSLSAEEAGNIASQPAAKAPVTMKDARFKITSDWELESNDGKIQTYTKYMEGKSLKAFKVVTDVDAPLPQVLMFLNDSTQFHRWIFMLKTAKILQQTDPEGISYNHMVTKVPWPIRNRDVVVRASISYDKDLGEVYIKSVAAPDFIPQMEDLVRINESQAEWRITKLSNGKLRLELTSFAEPGGAIPKWLSNMVVLQLPKHMFERLPEILESDEVKNMKFDSIQIFGKEVDLS